MTTSVDDIFKKPSIGSKRKLESAQDPTESYKSARLSSAEDAIENNDVEAGPELPDDEEGRFFGGGITEETTEILDYIDREEDKEVKVDLPWLRRTAIQFEKRITKNAELRAKFEGEPSKFMASEADLDSSIKELSLVSDRPEHFQEFVRLGCVKSLVDLLAHENTDIAIDALEIIAEFTDEDVVQGWDVLVDALLDADLLDLIKQVLERFDESNEADRNGVYHALSVMENLASRTSLSEDMTRMFAPWLLKRIGGRSGQNKQYSMEILAILSQNTTKLAEYDAEEILLQIIFRPDADEEFMEDVWNCLASIAGQKFINAEGVELCLKLLKDGNKRTLKVLNQARGVSQRIIEGGGLKTLFGLFMRKKQDVAGQDYERILGIFLTMINDLGGDSAGKIRLLAKFVEKDYEKLLRLVELRPARDDSPVSELTDLILQALAEEDGGIRQRLEAEE